MVLASVIIFVVLTLKTCPMEVGLNRVVLHTMDVGLMTLFHGASVNRIDENVVV